MIFWQQQITEWLEDDIPDVVSEYNSETTYNEGDFARVGNYQYRSTLEANKGNNPIENLGVYWVEWQPANDYSMLDLSSSYKTQWNAKEGFVTFQRGNKNYIALGSFTATTVTIQYLSDTDELIETETITFSNNTQVFDEWTYGYAPFSSDFGNVIFRPLKTIGNKIKVSFSHPTQNVDCGFFVSGTVTDGGKTIEGISMPDRRIGDEAIKVTNFTTITQNFKAGRLVSDVKKLVNIPMLFIVDESESSAFNNVIIIGKITKVEPNYSNDEYTPISWELEQTNY